MPTLSRETGARRRSVGGFVQPREIRLDVRLRQGPWLFAVDVGEAVVERHRRRGDDLSVPPLRLRVNGHGRNGAADELGTLGVAQVEHAGSQYGLGPHESGIDRDDGDVVGAQFVGVCTAIASVAAFEMP